MTISEKPVYIVWTVEQGAWTPPDMMAAYAYLTDAMDYVKEEARKRATVGAVHQLDYTGEGWMIEECYGTQREEAYRAYLNMSFYEDGYLTGSYELV